MKKNKEEENKSNECVTRGLKGLPEWYPTPSEPDLLFYIQRNQNINTVIYKLNRNHHGDIDLSNPIRVFWRQFLHGGYDQPLNYIQKELAYGYKFKVINDDTIAFNIVSYKDFKLYITKRENESSYMVRCKINGELAILSNVYVYVDEIGAFPIVEYIELYGIEEKSGLPCYEKIFI